MRFHSLQLALPALLGLLSLGLSAQTPFEEAPRRADVSAAWPGCDPRMTDCTKNRLAEFIAANIQLPAEARESATGGLVLVEFVVEKTGQIGEVRAVKDPGMGMAREAVRVISLMKERKMKWVPAENGGKRIAFRYTVPVSFNLQSPPKEKTATREMAADATDGVYVVAEVMPKYAGCATDTVADCTFRKLLEHIRGNLKYPEEALKNQVQGPVVAEFVVGADGSIRDVKIKNGIGSGCDEEALRVIRSMPAWTPGYQDGKAVPVRMTLPVLFQLPRPEDKD